MIYPMFFITIYDKIFIANKDMSNLINIIKNMHI